MEGRLLFAPDPFVKQKWYGFKSGYCVLKGSFLNFTERNTFMSSKPVEHSILLESCSVCALPHPKKHLFELVTSSGSKFNFIASSKGEADKWISKINERSSPLFCMQSNPSLTSQHLLSFSEDLSRKALSSSSSSHAIQSCASSLGRKKVPTNSSKISRDSERVGKKGALKDGLKRCGSMILSGTFTYSGTFGVPLPYCRSSPVVKHVPSIVVVCTDIIEERGLDHQGLYRVPGNTTQVNSLYHELMVSSSLVIDPDDERWRDINVVGSLLKLFFRKLPSPLITTELYKEAIEAIRRPSEQEKMSALRNVLNHLPRHYFNTFKYLARHLHKVASKEDANKMNAHNLSIVFGPTLVCSREENETARLVVDMPDQCKVVEVIIKNVDWIFKSNGYDNHETKERLLEDKFSSNDGDNTAMRPEFEIIFESHCENDDNVDPTAAATNENKASLSLDDVFNTKKICSNEVKDDNQHKPERQIQNESPGFLLANRNINTNNSLNSLTNSCASSTPSSSRGQSPFVDRQPMASLSVNPAKISAYSIHESSFQGANEFEIGNQSTGRGRNLSSSKTSVNLREKGSEGDLTEQALQHLKRLSFDLRTFKHRLEIEKLEQKQRTISKERIEREYEKALNEFCLVGGGTPKKNGWSADGMIEKGKI